MLQIITGKFFTTADLNVTRQRGVLFTNYHHRLDPVHTAAGSILPAEAVGDVSALVYEVDQRLEATTRDGQRSIIVAVSPDFLIQDFAAVVAFSLGVTCTPDFELARRLTTPNRSALGIPSPPRAYVARVFETKLIANPADETVLVQFVRDLVGLKRGAYEAVMRAIRRYVVGLHRIGDDLDLAYALLVASIESLAQEFDAFAPNWADYEQRKREALDSALTGVDPVAADNVRRAILAQEHVALGRRYREFALAHVTPAFFRDDATKATGPIRRRDLEPALERAYSFRSAYVHTLRELPRVLTAAPRHNDIVLADGKPALSFHGLARVARHVIWEFIQRSPKVDHEAYDYWSNLPGTLRVVMAERYWVWRADGYDRKSARRYLTGFLSELSDVLMGGADAHITDIHSVLEKVENTVKGLAPSSRLPMITLYVLFHRVIGPDGHRPGWSDFVEPYAKDFDAPSIESLIAHVLLDEELPWKPEDCIAVRDQYLTQRWHKNGLALSNVFETAVTLAVAEGVRRAGDEERTRALIADAVENLPGHRKLIDFERSADGSEVPPIRWRELLLPESNA